MKAYRIPVIVVMALALVAGGVFASGSSEGDQKGQTVAKLKGAPKPFDGSKKIRVALVRQLVEGEFMQMYEAGAKKQAQALGIELTILGKQNDNQAEANFVYQAADLGVDGIIIDHGLSETMMKPAADVVAKGIPVVAFDVDLKHPQINQIAQDDYLHGKNIGSTIVKDFSAKALVGYTFLAGCLPLDKRNVSWVEIKKANPGIVEVGQTGTFDSPISVKNADQAKAVLLAHPEIQAWLATYDEMAKGIFMALEELNMTKKVRLYSVDISTQDIQMMKKEGSPWVATSACNPGAVGAVSVRAIALKLAGQPLAHDITIPPTVFTQKQLRDQNVENMSDLLNKFPKFRDVDQARATWIPSAETAGY